MDFRVKICGITNVVDALVAADAGADAIGLNFYSGSRRYIDAAVARDISSAVGPRVVRVGVFVNSRADEIHCIRDYASLDAIQLHGWESHKFLSSLDSDLKIIRVRQLDDQGLALVAADLEACCQSLGRAPDAVLVDAAVPGEFGGSGQTFDWNSLQGGREWLQGSRLVLAGGLTPDSVAEAIRIVRPHAVDVASGVESSKGRKDPTKVRDFVAAARSAFEEQK